MRSTYENLRHRGLVETARPVARDHNMGRGKQLFKYSPRRPSAGRYRCGARSCGFLQPAVFEVGKVGGRGTECPVAAGVHAEVGAGERSGLLVAEDAAVGRCAELRAVQPDLVRLI